MTPFVETSVASEVFKTVDLARRIRENAAIVGRPGIGKTCALLAYARRQPDEVTYIALNAVTGNALRDLMRQIADRLGVYVSGSIADSIRQLLRYDFSERVLILDEAQNLKLQAFRTVLDLYDQAGLTIIFCGNEEVLKRVSTNKGAFAQIDRRVKVRTTLQAISDGDSDRLASAHGVEGLEAYKIVRSLASIHQTDGVVTVLEMARDLAGGKCIRADHIRRACEPFPQYRSALK